VILTYLETGPDAGRKFWSVALEGASLIVQAGLVGGAAQQQVKRFATNAAAAAAARRMIGAKRRQGFAEIAAPAAVLGAVGAVAGDAPADDGPSTEASPLEVELAVLVAACYRAERELWTWQEIGFDDSLEQAYGAPAALDDIAALEASLGWPLPPSYRAFLAAHGEGAEGGVVGPAGLRTPEVLALIADKRTLFDEFEVADPFAAGALPLILTSGRRAVLLVPPPRPDHEVAAVEYDLTDEVGRWPSLVAFLQAELARFHAQLAALPSRAPSQVMAVVEVATPRSVVDFLLSSPAAPWVLRTVRPWLEERAGEVIRALVSEDEASRLVAALRVLPDLPATLRQRLADAAGLDPYLDASMKRAFDLLRR
jgi:predicted DNA-binding WGR domain protein